MIHPIQTHWGFVCAQNVCIRVQHYDFPPLEKLKNCQLVALMADSEHGVTYECPRAHLKKIRLGEFNSRQLQSLIWLNRTALPGNHYIARIALFFFLLCISNLESISPRKFSIHAGLSVGRAEDQALGKSI